MKHHRTPIYPLRVIYACFLCTLLVVQQGLTTADAQHSPAAISLGQIPAEGILLNQGWQFQAGNNPNGASPQLDDRQWTSLDPSKDIRELPQLQRTHMGWLRLHLITGPTLTPTMLHMTQSVASEVYTDGQLLYHFGRVSSNPDSVQAYDPNAAFNLPLIPSSQHVLAIRFARQTGLDYDKKHLRWGAPAVQFMLFPAQVLPAFQPMSVRAFYFDTLKIGISFILFIIHLSLFIAYRKQRANLYAAGMYLMLSITFWARANNDFGQSMSMRIILYYGSLIDVWVPCVVILTFYTLFNVRKGWLFWLAIGSVVLRFSSLATDYQWLNIALFYYLPLELIRLSVVAIRHQWLGARIVAVGACCNLGLSIGFTVLSALDIPADHYAWLYDSMYVSSFLCFPLTLSLRLALEHGWVNRQLMVRLQEVENLSARNLAHQEERQQLLARQNEQLEQQVAERTEELHQQANQLRALDLVKSRFVTNITHEFRTPLTLILSPVEALLQKNRFDRPMLTLVQRNAGQLLRLINQLLDLSKPESNHMAIAQMQGNVAEFINHVVDLFRRSAEQKGVSLTCVVADMPSPSYTFDADKWEKILTNLLSNALKFTDSGGQITLTVAPTFDAGEVMAVQIHLCDSGIGMSSAELPHIFNRFYQVDTSSTRAYGGTGIGLALVHELIGLLGGTIAVESELRVGTTFRLTLPVGAASATASVTTPIWPQASQLVMEPPRLPVSVISYPVDEYAVPRILIIEDNEELRTFLVGQLTPSYQIIQAIDGEEGWALSQTELPDIVLTDVMMPRMDGYELTRLIKNHPDTDHIAVVMLTARTAQQSRIDGLQQGADDYLAKPFSIAELHLRIHNLATRQQKLRDHYRQQFILPIPGQADSRILAVEHNGHQLGPASFLHRVYELLNGHLDNPTISVDWLADQLAMNRKTLYRKVQSLIQLSPTDLIRHYRLRRAAELLELGYTVAETADRVGFNTPSHFSRAFKEIYQQTPTEFLSSQKRAPNKYSLPVFNHPMPPI